eukprot:497836_1
MHIMMPSILDYTPEEDAINALSDMAGVSASDVRQIFANYKQNKHPDVYSSFDQNAWVSAIMGDVFASKSKGSSSSVKVHPKGISYSGTSEADTHAVEGTPIESNSNDQTVADIPNAQFTYAMVKTAIHNSRLDGYKHAHKAFTPTVGDIKWAIDKVKRTVVGFEQKAPRLQARIIGNCLSSSEDELPDPCAEEVVTPRDPGGLKADGTFQNPPFHEEQSAALCGIFALNNILQKVVWNARSMDKIADCVAHRTSREMGHEMSAVELHLRDADYQGHYSWELLEIALGKVGAKEDVRYSGHVAGSRKPAAPFTTAIIQQLKRDQKFIGFVIKFATIDAVKHVAHHYVSIRYMRHANKMVYFDSIEKDARVLTGPELLKELNKHVGANEEFVSIIKQK